MKTSETDSKLNGLNENKIISSLLQLRERYWDNAVHFPYHLIHTLESEAWFHRAGFDYRKVGEFTGCKFIWGKGFSEIRSVPHLTPNNIFKMYRFRFKHKYKYYPRKKWTLKDLSVWKTLCQSTYTT